MTRGIRPAELEKGNALILALVLTMLLFGAASAMMMVSTRGAKAAHNDTEYKTALYLAEGGLAAAKEELTSQTDHDDDGIGNVTIDTPVGTYEVLATEVEPDVYRLDSRGTSQDRFAVEVQEMVELIPTTRFPTAAVSILGEVDKLKLKFKKHLDLLIDGGDKPAFAIDNLHTYKELVEDFGKAVKDSALFPAQVKGNGGGIHGGETYSDLRKWAHWKEFEGDDEIILPFGMVEAPSADMVNLDPLYADFIAGAKALIPGAQSFEKPQDSGTGAENFTFGTADEPVTVNFTDTVHMHGTDRLSGYGTLIVSEDLKLHDNATLDWVGDVILLAGDGKKSKLEVDGPFNVNGNVLVLGEGLEDVEVKFRNNSETYIDGSMFIGTLNEDGRGKKAKLEVDGKVHVTGMMSVLGGKKVEVKFKDDSDFLLEGMLQLSLGNFAKDDQLKLEFDGKVEILKDDAAMLRAAKDIVHLSDQLETNIEVIIDYEITTRHWSKVNEGEHVVRH